MGARQKLNASYANGAFLLAGAVGVLTGSWSVFGIALAGLLLTNVLAGNIRGGGGRSG
jgi:hypothetical protein